MRTSAEEWCFTLDQYKEHLVKVILPFWHRAVDSVNGGVFTCYSNDGRKLVSRDKFVWSQGRFLWVWSRIASMIERRLLPGDAKVYYDQARKTARFLMDCAFLDNGNCAFLLSETGRKKEQFPGEGFDTSIFADCFVLLGLTEYARVSNDNSIVETALRLFHNIRERVKSGQFRSEPYPVPSGFRAHAIPMIMLHLCQELSDTLEVMGCRGVYVEESEYMSEILTHYMEDDGRIRELLPLSPEDKDTLLCRHANPGHAIESMWFLMRSASRRGDFETVQRAVRCIRKALEIGWDFEYGGLFRFVDYEGGQPRGRRIGDRYEQLILDTWDTKLWWPHAEALYATLLGYFLTKDEDLLRLYKMVERYTFKTFPNPDPKVGEWIQIRNRKGEPIDKVVALPVKDPYHITRSLLLIIELIHGELTGGKTVDGREIETRNCEGGHHAG